MKNDFHSSCNEESFFFQPINRPGLERCKGAYDCRFIFFLRCAKLNEDIRSSIGREPRKEFRKTHPQLLHFIPL
ncbi:hypothetical protein LEP1GSC058_3155 [Leptospira fainei serovar Hurstbridge str. BUT 6]|uniref:Uncharacterized protein n=1 Tax=Leptospira fainei serovar Hurstbridge str. BUT 6 TaxID=1193011 RepID=S3V0Q2_9LEPT|nr:hypothetical protein LEP1GSC058_3155 [Leptospira fainei serovar Hurstbridge str. BUT 6]